MNSKGSVNYKTVAEFNEAMQLAFQTALEQTPDDPALKSVSDKIAAAEEARAAYDAVTVPEGDRVRLGSAARQTQEMAEIALKKWYSGQWLGRQSRR